MFFYDTCSLLQNYEAIFKNVESSPFVVSNITFKEIEEIKTSRFKDEETKDRAKRVSALLNLNYGKYEVVNYEKEWDNIYLKPNPILLDNNDSRIVISAYVKNSQTNNITFITNDINLNNFSKALGLMTNNLLGKVDEEYTGYKVIDCFSDAQIAETYDRIFQGEHFDLLPNQYLLIKHNDSIIDAYVFRDNCVSQIQFDKFESRTLGTIKPFDFYQKIAMDSLRHNKMTLLRGHGGVGKSLLSSGYMFELLEKGEKDKIIIFCNPVAVRGAAKLGYYPGSRDLKLLDSQIGNFLSSKLGSKFAVERLVEEDKLLLLPMADIRGYDTSGMNAFLYIPEAQNLDIGLMKLCLQRVGEDNICILDGDDKAQVDLDAYAGANNGLKRVSKIFKGQSFYGEVTLPVCYRSKIAAVAENF